MAGACNYASLRFLKAPPKPPGSHPAGCSPVCADDGQLTYANIRRTRGAAEATHGLEERRPDTQALKVLPFWKKHNIQILLMMCLILLASCIGIGSQFFQMYKNNKRQISNLIKIIEMMNSTMQNEQQSCQEAHLASNLSATQMIINCTSLLHISWEKQEQSKRELHNATEKDIQMETKLNKMETQLNEVQSSLNKARQLLDDYEDTECCEKGWTLLAGICLYFSQKKMKLSASLKYCESKQAWLIGNRIGDPAVKAFMKAEMMEEGYWIGMRKNNWSHKWMDSRNPEINLQEYYICGIIHEGKLIPSMCSEWNQSPEFKYICEKTPLRIKLYKGMPV